MEPSLGERTSHAEGSAERRSVIVAKIWIFWDRASSFGARFLDHLFFTSVEILLDVDESRSKELRVTVMSYSGNRAVYVVAYYAIRLSYAVDPIDTANLTLSIE